MAVVKDLRRWLANAIAGHDVPLLDGPRLGERVLSLAREEGVVVLLHDKMGASCKQSLPEEFRVALLDAARAVVAGELMRQAEAKRVLAALGTAGVRALALKGTALAYWLYERPAQRSRGDFDVLVADVRDAERATAMLQELGYALEILAVADATGYETALERTTRAGSIHRIDLHWRLLNNARLANGMDFEEMWAHSQPIPALGGAARGLGRIHALLHAALHRVTNMPGGNQNRLIWLYDIHSLLQDMTAEDWVRLLDTSAKQGSATPLLDGFIATKDAFGTVIPERMTERLSELAASENWKLSGDISIASLDRAHLGALPWVQKPGWLRRKLFPSAEFMRYRYGVSGNAGLVGAYMRRWYIGLKRACGA